MSPPGTVFVICTCITSNSASYVWARSSDICILIVATGGCPAGCMMQAFDKLRASAISYFVREPFSVHGLWCGFALQSNIICWFWPTNKVYEKNQWPISKIIYLQFLDGAKWVIEVYPYENDRSNPFLYTSGRLMAKLRWTYVFTWLNINNSV